MFRSTRRPILRRRQPSRIPVRRALLHLVALVLLCAVVGIEFGMAPRASAFDHTHPSVDTGCQSFTFSQDGNPFPLCPGPFPGGGNCVWWAWEQWHLLGYNLPLNWGNAAEWAIDAERFGLPLGTQPRLGSIAVFPVADGVWAFGTAGHVAFVTAVSADRSTFNVTYQNYGDPTPMFTGTGYNVAYINRPRFQNGQLRFIYFPGTIDATRFSHLPGLDGNTPAHLTQVEQANGQLRSDLSSGTASRVALGLPPGNDDQEFTADFTGSGLTDLLLYNRQQGSLEVLTFAQPQHPLSPHIARPPGQNQPANTAPALTRVSLADALTPINGWGSALDIAIGDFGGSGHDDILLSDRLTGRLQLLSLSPHLTIQQHVFLPGWGPGWETYVGHFDGTRSDLFLYNRLLVPNPTFLAPTPTLPTSPAATPTASSTPLPTVTPTLSSSPTGTNSPTPTLTPTLSPTPSPTVTSSPSPTPTTTVTPTPTPTLTPTSTPSPTPTPSLTPTAIPSPSPTSSPTTSPSPTVSVTPSPNPSATSGSASRLALPAVVATPPSGPPQPGDDLSGTPFVPLSSSQPPPPPNILLLSFDNTLQIKQQRAYSLLHDSWEVYIGRFVSLQQDGLLLYDRTAGAARLLDFTPTLLVKHYQPLSFPAGNWDIHTGDFNASDRAQVLLYDPGSGDLQFLTFAPDLSLLTQVDNAGLNTAQVLYVGHFGLPALSVMLYDPEAGQSTFLAFDASLHIAQQIAVPSWDRHWQILLGAFQDHSACQSVSHCSPVDDVLLLNRQSGQMQQYRFTFGNQYQVFDNRLQAFLRDGLVITARVQTVDTSSFTWQTNLNASITSEELY